MYPDPGRSKAEHVFPIGLCSANNHTYHLTQRRAFASTQIIRNGVYIFMNNRDGAVCSSPLSGQVWNLLVDTHTHSTVLFIGDVRHPVLPWVSLPASFSSGFWHLNLWPFRVSACCFSAWHSELSSNVSAGQTWKFPSAPMQAQNGELAYSEVLT